MRPTTRNAARAAPSRYQSQQKPVALARARESLKSAAQQGRPEKRPICARELLFLGAREREGGSTHQRLERDPDLRPRLPVPVAISRPLEREHVRRRVVAESAPILPL